MAANQESEDTPGGYACKFVTIPPDSLLCQICQLVARDPQLSVCCGHNFCKACVAKVENDEGCPIATCDENESTFTTFPNKLSNREIKKLLIWCTNDEKGCGWCDELFNLEDHLQECEFEEIECLQNCGMMIERPKMDDHLKNECPCRQTVCEYCYVSGEHHMITGQHRNECLKMPSPCPNECGLENLLRDELEEHLCNCPLQKVQCQYHNIGCEAQILIGTQDEHDEVCMKEHFQMMRNELAYTKEEILDLKLQIGERNYHESLAVKRNSFQSDKNQEHEDSTHVVITRKSARVEYRKNPLATKEKYSDGETIVAPPELNFLSNLSNKGWLEFQEEFACWKKQSDFLLRQIVATMEWRTQLNVLSALTDHPDFKVTTPVVIKVTGVGSKKEFKTVYTTPAFFVHPNGCKVCLTVLPCGRGYRVTNFSLQVMNLSKPTVLGGTFTVSLLNQFGDTNHCSTKIKYKSNEVSQSSVDDGVS